MKTTDAQPCSDFGAELRALRSSRRLSVGEAACRAGVSVPAISNWEAGRRRPRGAPLARLLDALGADSRTRSRLLALTDPFHAQIALVHEERGAPLHLGTMLRALRLRAQSTQADLARAVGVTQAAVAQWEAGDVLPSPSALQFALYALGATAEEAAMATAASPSPSAFPDDPAARFDYLRGFPHGACEPMMLFNERDLWWRATQDPAWDEFLLQAVAQRTAWYGFEVRLDEVASLARRALRMASGQAAGHVRATPALLVLTLVRLRGGADPLALARSLKPWAAKLDASPERAWTLSVLALALAQADEPAAVRVAEEAVTLVRDHDPNEAWFRRIDLAEIHLRFGQPEAALDALGDYHLRFGYEAFRRGGSPAGLATRFYALTGAGLEPEAELIPTLRAYVERTGIPLYRDELARVERAEARRHRRSG